MTATTELAIKAVKKNGGHVSRSARSRNRLAAITLSAIAIAALGGCANPFHHSAGGAVKATAKTAGAKVAAAKAAATPAVTAQKKVTVTDKRQVACSPEDAWSKQAAASLQALYADVGALSADEHASNAPGVAKAGRKLVADVVAAATLPLPPVDQRDWKTLTAAYASAGTALAAGKAISAVPQLEAAGSAMTAFSSAVAQCHAGS